jgi:uncharacterized FlgJ-related protein
MTMIVVLVAGVLLVVAGVYCSHRMGEIDPEFIEEAERKETEIFVYEEKVEMPERAEERGGDENSNSGGLMEKYVFGLIDSAGFEHPAIVKAIAVLESGHFTSELFRKQSNIFGMRRVVRRETTQLDTDTGYGAYKSFRSCVEDMKIYWDLYFKGLTEQEVLEKLQRVYAEAPNYAETIKSMTKKYEKNQ